MASDLQAALTGDAGYSLDLRLTPGETETLLARVEASWLRVIRKNAPEFAGDFARAGIARYHELANHLEHGRIWPKRARTLPPGDVPALRETSLLRALEDGLGPVVISDEDGFGHEAATWRLVRPGEPADVGPVHADRWFADVGDEVFPPGSERVKVWIALVTEPGRNGLSLLPGSHRQTWRFHGERRHGSVKPQIDEDVEALGLQLVPTAPGDAIVFNENLLHGGVLNRGENTRVSLEFTALVKPFS